MPMKDEDKTELTGILKEAFVGALKDFRSQTEEEAAKAQQQEEKKDDNNDKDGNTSGFSFRGFLLGE